jgi:hypothetical protein
MTPGLPPRPGPEPPQTGSGSRFGGIPRDSVGTGQTRNSPRFPRDSLGNGRLVGEERTFDGEILMLLLPPRFGPKRQTRKSGVPEAIRIASRKPV